MNSVWSQVYSGLDSFNVNQLKLNESSLNTVEQQKIKKCQEGVLHYKNRYSYPKQKKIDINSEVLGHCFLSIYQSYHAGKETYFANLYADHEYEELMSYLAGSKEVSYSTGHESSLREWVLSQKDNSITPHVLFQKSLALNEGKLFASILTIHQLLRNEARFYADYITYNSNPDKLQQFYNKFVDIRGDLEERCDGKSGGDHSGSWYRIWGTMLDSINSVVPVVNNVCTSVKFSGSTRCFVEGCLISSLAEMIKPLYFGEFEEIDDRKSSINRVGYKVMDAFYKAAEDYSSPSENFYCDDTKYLETQ